MTYSIHDNAPVRPSVFHDPDSPELPWNMTREQRKAYESQKARRAVERKPARPAPAQAVAKPQKSPESRWRALSEEFARAMVMDPTYAIWIATDANRLIDNTPPLRTSTLRAQ